MRHSIYSRIRQNLPLNYKLTILIPTLFSRMDRLKSLIEELNFQIQSKPVQILWMGDNKSMTVGEKRNLLLESAKGEFICFIDDDDYVHEEYIKTLLSAIEAGKEIICFEGRQTTNGKEDCPFKYDLTAGRNHKKVINGVRYKVMLPDHLCVWKKSLIVEKFPLKNLGEDHAWASAMSFHYKNEDVLYLKETLYHYNYNKDQSECAR